LPVPRWLAAGLCAPAHRACGLLRPRPRSAPRRRDPRCFLRCASGQRLPAPMRTRGARGLRRDRPPAAPAISALRPRTLATRLTQDRGEREGSGEARPVGGRSHRAGACGSRAARPAGGYAGPDRLSCAREGNSEGSHAGLCLLGRTRRRVGGLGSMPSPSDRPQPAGQKETQSSICVPSSSTRLGGIEKNAVADCALRERKANRDLRHRHIFEGPVVSRVSRPR